MSKSAPPPQKKIMEVNVEVIMKSNKLKYRELLLS